MKLVLQRVKSGNVSVAGKIVAKIGAGCVILIGITHSDTAATAQKMAKKVARLRVFSDEAGKMNCSALNVGAEILVVSQFTLYANARRGRRPGYTDAAPPAAAKPLIEHFVQALQDTGIKKVAQGVFGADMLVEIKNDGPVTIILEDA